MDLAAWVAEGRYVGLLELIDMLPSACRLKEAIAQDEEAAEYILSLPENEGEGEPWSPPVAEFNLTNSLLTALINEVKMLRQSGQAVAGGKPKSEKPFPTPRTAVDRVRERHEAEWASDTLKLLGFDANGF